MLRVSLQLKYVKGINYNLSMLGVSITIYWYRLQLKYVKDIDYNLGMLRVSITT